MAQIITEDTILYVAELAKLHLDPTEQEQARQDLQQMLDYVEKLNDLPTEKVEPMSHVLPLQNVFREDTVTGTDMREEVLANAPQRDEEYYVVPITIA